METELQEGWIKSYWRPVLGWVYIAMLAFDFIIAPIMLTMFAKVTGTPLVMWKPLTLEGGGLVHLSLGSIITAQTWKRSEEKIKAIEAKILGGPEVKV